MFISPINSVNCASRNQNNSINKYQRNSINYKSDSVSFRGKIPLPSSLSLLSDGNTYDLFAMLDRALNGLEEGHILNSRKEEVVRYFHDSVMAELHDYVRPWRQFLRKWHIEKPTGGSFNINYDEKTKELRAEMSKVDTVSGDWPYYTVKFQDGKIKEFTYSQDQGGRASYTSYKFENSVRGTKVTEVRSEID